ncbi:MAG: lysophospholipid acyltransferase family protein [Bacteroidales bacterium]|nr:lysophospholipid acyltransferase family protein [Bacteroidales bacterium]
MFKPLVAAAFYLFVLMMGLMPFRVIYALSDGLGFFLNRIFAYRKGVIIDNITTAFADMPLKERKDLIKKVYRNLADIFLEGIKAFTMSQAQVNKRHRIINAEILDPYLEAGKSVIIVTGHYGNWEWGAFSAPLQTNFNVVGFYKPIRNKWINGFAKKSREKYGTVLATIYETTKTFERHRDRPAIYLMVADQSPRSAEKAIWVDFLDRETAFLHGPEKHSRLNDHPVIYVNIRRIRRGYYTLRLQLLADDPAGMPEGEITRRFAGMLESIIREEPANWLWSHKRWKLSR